MSRLGTGIAIAALTVFLGTPAQADWLRGHKLKAQCELDASRSEWSFCDGYVFGVAESLKLGGAICAPDDLEPSALSAIVVEYLREHEDVLTQVAFALTGRALKHAYPCPVATP
ncbi:MAG: hypothetical protein HQ511_10865 [Rhodospirillales bacterium]|nr:hypothetical protein [Rhodospirillales bacterium]